MKCKYFLLGMLPLFAACSDEGVDAVTEDSVVAFVVDDFEQEDGSRTSVTINLSSDRKQYTADFAWKAGDTLGVVPQSGVQTPFPLTQINAGGMLGNKAYFDGCDWTLNIGAKYVAYYPFSRSVYFNGGASNFKISYNGQKQVGESSSHVASYDYLVSDGGLQTVSKYSKQDVLTSGVGFQMKHVGALVKFTFVLPSTYAGSKTFKKLTIASTNNDFVTNGKINLLTTSTPTIEATAKSNTMVVDLEGLKPNIAKEVNVYAMMAPANYSGTWTITIEDADGMHSMVGTKSAKVKVAGTCYCLWFEDGDITCY